MSMILKFKTDQDRERFLDLVQRDRSDLLRQLAPNPLLPHLYARTDLESDEWLRERIARFGQAFEDVKFKPFAPEGVSTLNKGDLRNKLWFDPMDSRQNERRSEAG